MTALARIIGHDKAQALSERAGGTRFFVPLNLNGGKPPACIARRVGDDLAIVLILHFGGSLLYVPTGANPQSVSEIDVKSVARMTRRGLTANAIAKRLGCSERTVTAKRAKARSAGLLPPLTDAGVNGVQYAGKR